MGNVAGFSLHAGVATKAHQRKKLERLCRYIARAVVSEKRLSLTGQGKVRYELKTPYRDGTTHVIFIPGFLPSTLRASLRLFKIAPGDFVNPWVLCTGCTVCRERRKRWSGHCQAGSPGAKTPSQSDAFPWGVRTEQ